MIYDQRGAGFSEPKLCPAYDTAVERADNLRDEGEKERRLNEARRACLVELKTQGIDRRAYNTAASVADLIDLRHTLHYESWDLYGPSYGARLQLPGRAAALHPARPGACVHGLWQQPACRDAFPNVEQDFYAGYDDLTTSPVPIIRPGGGPDMVWFDGQRLVDDIRNGLVNRPRIVVARLPLWLQRAARR